MSLSPAVAWAALLLVPGVAVLGLFLRRAGRGPMVARMRPHLVLGYVAAGLAVAHVAMTTGGMGAVNPTGIWLATFALFGLGLQAFVGTNLQSPGAYRAPLRRWHLALFWIVLLLAIGHVVLNSPMTSQSTASARDRVLARHPEPNRGSTSDL